MADKPIFPFLEGTTPDKQKEYGIPINVKEPTLGYYLLNGPEKPPGQESASNQYFSLNFTSPPGAASAIYFSLIFWLMRQMYHVEKPDEWIEVSPTHREYYERTMAVRQQMEQTIKTSLISISQSIADYELIKHDVRKYYEILDYFRKKDEYSLRAMFIDQVDVHTGPTSLISIAPRWSTIISDFQRLKSEDTEPDSIKKRLNISTPEATILATKNRLYNEWKELFGRATKERYELLRGQIASREKTIKEYKEWLKPYIARFRMARIGAAEAPRRAQISRSFADITGLSTFANYIRIWAWKPLKPRDTHTPAFHTGSGGFALTPGIRPTEIRPDDAWMRENYIFNEKIGLAKLYPWLNYGPTGKTEGDVMIDKILKQWKARDMRLDPSDLYYMFIEFCIDRVGTRLQVGELEDITFNAKCYAMSQNVLLLKILELRCREREMEYYIEEMLGTRIEEKDLTEFLAKEMPEIFGKQKPAEKGILGISKALEGFAKPFEGISTVMPKRPQGYGGLSFIKPGPYETEFKDRITKVYLKPAGEALGTVNEFIKGKMGIG
jgi:hypothetical protein